MKTARFLIFVLAVSLLPVNVFGQTANTARVSGVVTDPNNAVVAGATVKLINKATKIERSDATNSEGRYVFPGVEPGVYDISVAAQGFRTTIVSNVRAEVSKVATVDIAVQAGGANETVSVTASGEIQLQKDDPSIGGVIDSDRIKRLPTIDRQVTSLLALQPAVAPTGETSGSRADQNMFSLDGIDVSDNVIGGSFTTVVPTPTESVEEFRVTTANPNTTFGRSAGAQVVLVTKRGTDLFHGSLYEYHQNDNLNANSWTNNFLGNKKPPLIDNRFGGSVGGPIFKEKLFFFFNYEGRRLPGTRKITRVVPTESLRAGLLKFRDASGAVFTINPKTLDPRNLGANPTVLASLAKMPLPNNFTFGDGLNTGGFTSDFPSRLDDNFGVLRMDYQVKTNWNLEFNARGNRAIQTDANQANLIDLKGGNNIATRSRQFTLGVTGTLRPNLVNETRVGYVYSGQFFGAQSPTASVGGFNVATNLAPGPLDFDPNFALLDEPIDVDTQRARVQSIYSPTLQIVDNATWSKGTHTVQFGGSMRRIKTYHYRDDKVIGSVATPVANLGAAGSVTISPSERPPQLQSADLNRYDQFYAALLGIVDSVGYLAVRDAQFKPLPPGTGLVNDTLLNHWEFYAADVWKMRPDLTLSFGLMYQWHTPPNDKEGRQTLLVYKDSKELVDPLDYLRQKAAAAEQGNIFNPDLAYIPVNESGLGGVFKVNRKDFSPRFSIAWEPSYKSGFLGKLFGERKSVIRGGYSLLYDRVNTVSSVIVPMLGVGFAQTLTIFGPTNSRGEPFRAGVDGSIPIPENFAATSPFAPSKPFGETLSFGMDPNIKDPYNHSVTFTIQRELPGRFFAEVGYVGRFARNLYQNVNLNAAPYFFKDKQSGQRFSEAFDAVAGAIRNNRAVTAQPWFENQLFPGATGVLAGAFAGDFNAGNLNYIWNLGIDFVAPQPYNNQQSLDLFIRTSLGRSNYNALVFSLHKRASYGLTMDFNYTYSRSLDQIGQIQNFASQLSSSYDENIDYAPSDFDFNHTFNANGVYDLPFGKGRRFSTDNWVDNVIGGWNVAGIWQASSGAPLTVTQGFQVYGAGVIFGTNTGAIPITKPDVGNSVNFGVKGSGGVGDGGGGGISGVNLFGNPESVFKNFRKVEISKDGRSGRGALRGFSRWQFDMSVGKQTKITEKVKFTLSFDFFNIFNHVTFADPVLNLANPATFGVVTHQLEPGVDFIPFYRPRVIQLGGRIEF